MIEALVLIAIMLALFFSSACRKIALFLLLAGLLAVAVHARF